MEQGLTKVEQGQAKVEQGWTKSNKLVWGTPLPTCTFNFVRSWLTLNKDEQSCIKENKVESRTSSNKEGGDLHSIF